MGHYVELIAGFAFGVIFGAALAVYMLKQIAAEVLEDEEKGSKK